MASEINTMLCADFVCQCNPGDRERFMELFKMTYFNQGVLEDTESKSPQAIESIILNPDTKKRIGSVLTVARANFVTVYVEINPLHTKNPDDVGSDLMLRNTCVVLWQRAHANMADTPDTTGFPAETTTVGRKRPLSGNEIAEAGETDHTPILSAVVNDARILPLPEMLAVNQTGGALTHRRRIVLEAGNGRLNIELIDGLESQLKGFTRVREWCANLDIETMRTDAFASSSKPQSTKMLRSATWRSARVVFPQIVAREYTGHGVVLRLFGIINTDDITALSKKGIEFSGTLLSNVGTILAHSNSVFLSSTSREVLERLQLSFSGLEGTGRISAADLRLCHSIRAEVSAGGIGKGRQHPFSYRTDRGRIRR